MKKNQKTYLLLAAVIVVWVGVGFQIYRHYEPDAPIVINNSTRKVDFKQPQKQADYTISPDYRDPFLGKIYRKPKPKVKKQKPAPVIVFPQISYNGMISGESTTYIISINGTQEILKLKDVIKGVELVQGNQNEVTLRFKGATEKYAIVR